MSLYVCGKLPAGHQTRFLVFLGAIRLHFPASCAVGCSLGWASNGENGSWRVSHLHVSSIKTSASTHPPPPVAPFLRQLWKTHGEDGRASSSLEPCGAVRTRTLPLPLPSRVYMSKREASPVGVYGAAQPRSHAFIPFLSSEDDLLGPFAELLWIRLFFFSLICRSPLDPC